MSVLFFANDAPVHPPPPPPNRRTGIRVWGCISTQSMEKEGTITTTVQDTEDEVPLFEFLRKKSKT